MKKFSFQKKKIPKTSQNQERPKTSQKTIKQGRKLDEKSQRELPGPFAKMFKHYLKNY